MLFQWLMINIFKKETTDWNKELYTTATRYHIIGCWAAIILDPLWVINDYFIFPSNWIEFFILRLIVVFATLIGVLFRKPLKISPELLIIIPFLGISLQNAYMQSVMDLSSFQKHTFAYIALFIGGGMLILWKPVYSIIVVILSFIASIILLALFSKLSIEEIMVGGGLLTATVAVFSVILIHTRYTLTKKEIIARLALKESNQMLAVQKEIIEQKNKDITDSINYAKRIQHAILPENNKIAQALPGSFILFIPKDIVSGDFYWFSELQDQDSSYKIIAAIDCTGHGVPGAFMSMIGNDLLNQIVKEKRITAPSEILNNLHNGIRESLKQYNDKAGVKDGMDISLCSINIEKKELQYAGAHNSLYFFKKENEQFNFKELKADRYGIGGEVRGAKRTFTNHCIKLETGDTVYLFTDGFHDQFGGSNNKKYTSRRFRELLHTIQNMKMNEQQHALKKSIDEWKGNEVQTDDILVLGIKI